MIDKRIASMREAIAGIKSSAIEPSMLRAALVAPQDTACAEMRYRLPAWHPTQEFLVGSMP